MQKFNSAPEQVWRNMVVAGLNAAIAQHRLTLKPGPVSEAQFTFTLAGLPAYGRVLEILWDEVVVIVRIAPGVPNQHPLWPFPVSIGVEDWV